MSSTSARTRSRSRLGRVLAATALLAVTIGAAQSNAFGATGTNVADFDIDAEIQADGTLDDWSENGGTGDGVIDLTASTTDGRCAMAATSEGVLICDDVKNDGDIFEGGNKESDPANWSFKSGQVTPKTDITNVYALGRFDAGDPVLINGMERLPKSGSLNLDFEFNKEIDEATGVPIRSENDVLIAYDLGGARSSDVNAMSVKVFIADANGEYDYDNPDVEIAGADGVTTNGVTGIMNTAPIDCGPWGCFDEHGALTDTLPEFSFAEAAVNLEEAVGLSDVCFNWVTVRSRASESVTSQLKDTTEPTAFPFCGGLSVHKYIDVGTTGLGTRNPTGALDLVNDVDTAAEDTLGDLDGWAMTVHGPQVSSSDPGPLVCNGTTDSAGVLVCAGADQDLSSLLPGVYTITETSVPTGWYNTDPGGSSPYVKTTTVVFGGQQTAYVGNTCLVDFSFSVTGAPTGTNAPTSVTVQYEINNGTSQTLALTANGSTWSGAVNDTFLPGSEIDWRFYINGNSAVTKTGGTNVALGGYPTCSGSGSVAFGTATLSGFKYKDANADGDFNAGESPLSGVSFELWHASEYGVAGNTAIASTSSAADGSYSFTGVQAGSYIVDEVNLATGWAQTEPASNGTRSVTVALGQTSATIGDFGNTPLSKIDVTFTSLGLLPGGGDATEATTMTCYRDYGGAGETSLGTTSGNTLSVTNLKTSDSSVVCVIAFEDP